MLFELTNVSTTCQEIINNILPQYLNQFVIAYLNDIIIYLKILKEHISYIFKVLEYLNIRNLYFKSKKYKFYRKKVDFVRIDFKKLQAIQE